MNDMVERVARAIFAKLTAHADVLRPGAPFLSWDALPEEQKVMTRAAARAAIAAMREPTMDMVNAGLAVISVTDIWQNMIDAILAEGR